MASALTRYERLAAERAGLRWRLVPPRVICGIILAAAAHEVSSSLSLGGFRLPFSVVFFFAGTMVAGRILERVWPWYAGHAVKWRDIRGEIAALAGQTSALYTSVPRRPFRSQFKKHYDLNNKSLAEFERLLVIGMRNERREVWVTAFCRGQHVARATATMGSARRCRPSDDVTMWPARARELACSEIRQYHNHPGSYRHASPSQQDRVSSGSLKRLLDRSGIKLRSYLVFWNEIGEYRFLEYDSGKEEQLVYVFDAGLTSRFRPIA